LQAQLTHQPLDRAARHGHTFAVELTPDFVSAVDLHVGLPHALDLRHQACIALRATRAQRRVALTGCMAPVRRRGDLQDATDRLDPELLAMLVDEGLQDLMRRSSSAWAKNALASFRISLALRSSRTSRSSSFTRCASLVVTPSRTPASTSARLTHSFSVYGTQPILGAMDSMAAHSDGYYLRCSCTILTARTRTSGENLFDLLMAQSSQSGEPPRNPGAVHCVVRHFQFAALQARGLPDKQASTATAVVGLKALGLATHATAKHLHLSAFVAYRGRPLGRCLPPRPDAGNATKTVNTSYDHDRLHSLHSCR
jgi:hypothetical protein